MNSSSGGTGGECWSFCFIMRSSLVSSGLRSLSFWMCHIYLFFSIIPFNASHLGSIFSSLSASFDSVSIQSFQHLRITCRISIGIVRVNLLIGKCQHNKFIQILSHLNFVIISSNHQNIILNFARGILPSSQKWSAVLCTSVINFSRHRSHNNFHFTSRAKMEGKNSLFLFQDDFGMHISVTDFRIAQIKQRTSCQVQMKNRDLLLLNPKCVLHMNPACSQFFNLGVQK